ncbi:unnamed protein product [Paramecium sonneborni]|uniref:Uncharacterized protein n=1 Tax=Paramecium sonneborni TaxID=65129 RepID=A0A8S1MT49_9CILI|nr:unnamed protein product [Paramecium sonneborni]
MYFDLTVQIMQYFLNEIIYERLNWEDSKPRTNFGNKNIRNFNKEDFEDLVRILKVKMEMKIKYNEEKEDWRNSFKNSIIGTYKYNYQIAFQSIFNTIAKIKQQNRICNKQKNFQVPKEGTIDDFFVVYQEQKNDNEKLRQITLKIFRKKLELKQRNYKKHILDCQLKMIKIKNRFNPNNKSQNGIKVNQI